MRRPLEYRTPAALRERLTGVFRYTAVGRGGALTLAQLLARPGIGEHGERAVRRAIAELVVIDRLPIAGDAGPGYYLCSDWSERGRQLHQIWSRILRLMDRADTFAAGAAGEVGGQPALDFSEEPTVIAALQARQAKLRSLLADLPAMPDE